MRKFWFNLLILCALFLSACSQAQTPAASTAAAPSDTKAPAKPTKQVSSGPTMQCSVVSMIPTQGPTEVSRFPTVSEKDWVLGAKNPSMTIIEYSDYQ